METQLLMAEKRAVVFIQVPGGLIRSDICQGWQAPWCVWWPRQRLFKTTSKWAQGGTTSSATFLSCLKMLERFVCSVPVVNVLWLHVCQSALMECWRRQQVKNLNAFRASLKGERLSTWSSSETTSWKWTQILRMIIQVTSSGQTSRCGSTVTSHVSVGSSSTASGTLPDTSGSYSGATHTHSQ